MTWPTSKFDAIVEVLALTGDNLPSVANDGSDEWTVASAAYEMAIEYMFENADWKQITNVVTLISTGTKPTDDQFDTAYAKPQDCIHVIWVRMNDLPTVYQILNNQIVLRAQGLTSSSQVPPPTTGVATMKYVSSAPPGITVNGQVQATTAQAQMTRTFMTALKRFVMSGVYRGLHEDLVTARSEEAAARQILQEARQRSDAEQPKRAPINSRISAVRRVRKPWPANPRGWGGTGGYN